MTERKDVEDALYTAIKEETEKISEWANQPLRSTMLLQLAQAYAAVAEPARNAAEEVPSRSSASQPQSPKQ